LHSVSDVRHLESKIVVLENMLKGLSPQVSQLSQISTVFCSYYQVLDHSLNAYAYLVHQLATEQEQASMAFQRPQNDLFSPYYNPGWRNYHNLSWNSGPKAMAPNSQPGMFPGNNS